MIDFVLGRRLQGKLPMLPSFAAAMAFYFLVSLVPILVVVSSLVKALFSANLIPELIRFLRDVLPPESTMRPEAFATAIQSTTGGLAAASSAAALWTASAGMNEMSRAIHYLFSEPERPDTGGWLGRLKAFVVLAIWSVAIGAGGVAFVLLPLIHGELARLGAARILPPAFESAVRYPTAFALLFFAFACTYVFVPRKSPSWSAAAQGAALAASVWSAAALLFSYFLPKVWHVSVFSGAMSSVLAVLVWAYCGAWGVLLGAAWAVRVDEA